VYPGTLTASLPNKPGIVIVPKLVASEAFFVYTRRERRAKDNARIIYICYLCTN
jgi:hypothetical protein